MSSRESIIPPTRLADWRNSFGARLSLVFAIVALSSVASLLMLRSIVASLHTALYSAVDTLEVVHASENFHSRLHFLLVAANTKDQDVKRSKAPDYVQARRDAVTAFETLQKALGSGIDLDHHVEAGSDSGLLPGMTESLAAFLKEADGAREGGISSADHYRRAREVFDTIFSCQLEIVHERHETRLASIKATAHSMSNRADRIFYVPVGIILLSVLIAVIFSHKVLARDFRMAEEGATVDGLTGAKNRRYLEGPAIQMVKAMIDASMPFSLALCDIDHFKALNDRHGHQAGDLALVSIAKTMIDGLRNNDIVIRFGGEEFLIILPGTGKASVVGTIEGLRAGIASLRIPLDGDQSIGMTASFGIASFPDDSHQSYPGLLKLADERLYEAKRSGRNRVIA